jgi:hypothetical protein
MDASFSSLPIYSTKGKLGGINKRVGFDNLTGPEKVNKIIKQVQGGYYPIGSENRMNEGTLQDVMAGRLHPWARPTYQKQDSTYRALSKGITLAPAPGSPSFYSNEAYEDLLGTNNIPETGAYVGNILPQDKAFFNSFPATYEEFLANEQHYKNMVPHSGKGTWKKFRKEIKDLYDKRTDAFRQFGRMGETEFLMRPDFAEAHKISMTADYEMDRKNVSVGQSINEGDVIGFNDGSPVLATGNGAVVGVSDVNGKFKMTVDHLLDLDGAKPDVNSVKGQSFTATAFDDMVRAQNALYKVRGETNMIPSHVNLLADATYNVNKASVVDNQMAMLGSTLQEAFNGPDSEFFEGIDSVIPKEGSELPWPSTEFNEGSSIFDVYNFTDKGISLKTSGLSKDAEVSKRQLREIFDLGQQVLDNANLRIRQKISEGIEFNSPVFSEFARSGASDFKTWSLQNAQAVHFRVWDSNKLYAAQKQSLTYDMETFASLSGNQAAVKELRSRRELYGGGSLEQTQRFVEHLANPTDNPLLTTITADKAFPSPGSLTTPEGLAGSIFDPGNEAYSDNFRIDLGEGGKHRYVPVLGHGAYGGTNPKYGPESFQARDYQNKIKKITRTKDPSARDALVDELHEDYIDELARGKGSVMRPYSYDNDSITGFLRTQTSSDPFDVFIGDEMLDTIHDSDMRKSLMQGQHAYGMMWRQPISEAMHVRLKYDPSLTGGRGIAASEKLYRLYQADSDKDPIGISLWKKGTDAYQEAHEAINSGRQLEGLNEFYKMAGTSEDSMTATNAKIKSWEESASKYFDAIGSSQVERTIQNRTAGGTIGQFSNALSSIMESVASNVDITRDVQKSARLKGMLFQIRQAPINARKSHSAYDLADALRDRDTLINGFSHSDEDTAFDLMHQAMQNIVGVSVKPGESSPLLDALNSDQGKQDLRDVIRSRNEVSIARARVLMGQTNKNDTLNIIRQHGIAGLSGTTHGFAAGEAAAAQGRMNAATAEAANAGKKTYRAAKDAFRVFSDHYGKAALIGLGAVAALGLFSRSSSRGSLTANGFRPEDTAGVADRVPGDPIIGSAAANAPMSVSQHVAGTSYAMVAPLNNATNTNVKLRARDNNQSVELAKSMSRLSNNGNQHVNINYSKDARISTLRFREKLKDMRDK